MLNNITAEYEAATILHSTFTNDDYGEPALLLKEVEVVINFCWQNSTSKRSDRQEWMTQEESSILFFSECACCDYNRCRVHF